jgi:hypothetical protein
MESLYGAQKRVIKTTLPREIGEVREVAIYSMLNDDIVGIKKNNNRITASLDTLNEEFTEKVAKDTKAYEEFNAKLNMVENQLKTFSSAETAEKLGRLEELIKQLQELQEKMNL